MIPYFLTILPDFKGDFLHWSSRAQVTTAPRSFPLVPSTNHSPIFSTVLESCDTHWASQEHIPLASRPISPSLLRAFVADWWPLRRRVELRRISAGLVSRVLQCPHSACGGQQRAAAVSGSIRPPTCLPTVSDRGGRQQRGGEQREVTRRRGRTTEEAGKNTSFYHCSLRQKPCAVPLSPCLFLHLFPPPLSRLHLTLSFSPQNPIILLLLPHTHSLIPNLSFPLDQPFSIVLLVPLCYPPPPSSPLCLSLLNMPPLSITLLHTPDDCSTPYFLSFISSTFFFFPSPPPPVVFFVISHTSCFGHHNSAQHPCSLWCLLVITAAWFKCHYCHHHN